MGLFDTCMELISKVMKAAGRSGKKKEGMG
jgi:hypothetical protein